MLSVGCHGVSEQLMAAGATEDDVKQISQVVAQTVRKLETVNAAPEPGPEALSLPSEVVGSDEEFSNIVRTWIQQNGHLGPRSNQDELVKRHHRKEASGEEMQTGRRRFVACSLSGSWTQLIAAPFFYLAPSRLRRPIRSNWPVGNEFDQQK